MIMKQSFFRADASNCCAKPVEKLFVNTGAALGYGGYGQAQEFKPASFSTQMKPRMPGARTRQRVKL